MIISLAQAIKKVSSGEIVAVPTETVYGLAASLHFPQAIEGIFSLKKRAPENPLTICIASLDMMERFRPTFPPHFYELAEKFWPGPLTLVLPVDTHAVPAIIRANLPTAGFRIPKHPLTLDLIRQIGPIVLPSANISGRPSSTTVQHIESDFGKDFPILDGGSCEYGLESTLLSFIDHRWKILRLGVLTSDMLSQILGYFPEVVPSKQVKTNQKQSDYVDP